MKETWEPILLWIPPAAVVKIQDETILPIHLGRELPLPRCPLLGADTEVVSCRIQGEVQRFCMITLVRSPQKGKEIIYKSNITRMLIHLP